MPKDQKYCGYCERFFNLDAADVYEWHKQAKCRKRFDVKTVWKVDLKYPARVEQFVNVQTDEIIPPKALEGFTVRSVFRGSDGSLIVEYG